MLNRVQTKVDEYTGEEQAAYKKGRSTGDIVRTQRMLNSIVLTKHWSYNKMGIDMSKAFDTILRTKLVAVMKEAKFNNNEIRMVIFLLTNTKLKIKINSLSGALFTLYLAAALKQLREEMSKTIPQCNNTDLLYPRE